MKNPFPQRRDLDIDLLQIMLSTAALVLLVPMPLWLVGTISLGAVVWSYVLFHRFGRQERAQRQAPPVTPDHPVEARAARRWPVERPVALLMVLSLAVGMVITGLFHLPDWVALAHVVLTLLIGTVLEIRLNRSASSF